MVAWTKPAAQIFASVDENGVPRTISEQESAVWGTELERMISTLTQSVGASVVRGTKAELDAIVGDYTNGTIALVVIDPVIALRGIYKRVAGVWVKQGDLPADALSGAAAAAQASAVASQVARVGAETAKAGAEAARDLAAGFANTAITGGTQNDYGLISAFSAVNVPAGVQTAHLSGNTTFGDGKGGKIRRMPVQPVIGRKVRSGDRLLPNGTTDATNGGWWSFYEDNESRPILILARGQSNMANRDAFTWAPPSNLVRFNNAIEPTMTSVGNAFAPVPGNIIGAADAFAARVAWANPHRSVYLVVVAYPGLAIANWLAPAFAGKVDMHTATVNNLTAAIGLIGPSYELIDLWWQGEQDITRTKQDYWLDHLAMTSRLTSAGLYPAETQRLIFGVSPVFQDLSNVGGGSEAIGLARMREMNDTLARVASWYRAAHFIDSNDFAIDTLWTPSDQTYNRIHMTGAGYDKCGENAWNQYSKCLGGAANRGMYVNSYTGAIKLPSAEMWNVGTTAASIVGPAFVTYGDQQLGRVNAAFQQLINAATGEVIVHETGAYMVGFTARNQDASVPAYIEVHRNGASIRQLAYKVNAASMGGLCVPLALTSGDVLKVRVVSGTITRSGSSGSPVDGWALDFYGHFLG